MYHLHNWIANQWMNIVKMYKFPGIRQTSNKDVMYSMINVIHTAVCYSYHGKESIFFFFFYIVSIWGNVTSLNLPSADVWMSNHYAIQFKHIEHCSVLSRSFVSDSLQHHGL